MFNIDLLSLLLGKQGDKKQYEHGQFFMFKKMNSVGMLAIVCIQ